MGSLELHLGSERNLFFLTDSFGIEVGVVSGDKNALSNDETQEDLVCLPDEGPFAVAPELSPFGARNTSVSKSESAFSGNSFPLLSIKRSG